MDIRASRVLGLQTDSCLRGHIPNTEGSRLTPARRVRACMLRHFICDCSPPGPLSMAFSRQDYQCGLPCSPPGDPPDPGIKPMSLRSPAFTGGFFTTRLEEGLS